MRLFELHRDHDVSGVSGVGVVAEGVQFSDGTCVVRWVSPRGSTVVWHSLEDVVAIHGHGGATRVVWLDADLPQPRAAPVVGDGPRPRPLDDVAAQSDPAESRPSEEGSAAPG